MGNYGPDYSFKWPGALTVMVACISIVLLALIIAQCNMNETYGKWNHPATSNTIEKSSSSQIK